MNLRIKALPANLIATADLPLTNQRQAPAYLIGPPKPAAVLIPLTLIEDKLHVVYIRRAQHHLDRHSGQVAFPGGRIETSDATPEAAALREAQEEIGLAGEIVNLLGRLPDYLTITNFRVTPIVGYFDWGCELKPEPKEVARIFTMPLDWLANPENHELRDRPAPLNEHHGKVVYFQNYDGELLWGATARMTLALLMALDMALDTDIIN